MDQNAKQQIIDRLKQANNILITVSNNPSVDQLAACIGFTLLINKLGKHGTAVFSGKVPSTLEFLKPEETIETNTDSLRDFIIALDKAKADKLRYKVEDTVVKIFITPYRTSLSDKDLDFSQGDFNVDVVLALGVHERTELDQAIVAHGRILHDATVISVNNRDQGNLGTINWVDLNSSCLSEMLMELVKGLTADPIDGQMATAFLTGIVAETSRFSNEKTSPRTMTIASELMTAGANQQLISAKLEEVAKPQPAAKSETKTKTEAEEPKDAEVTSDGSLKISHQDKEKADEPEAKEPKLAKDEPADLPPVVEDEADQPVAPPTPAAPAPQPEPVAPVEAPGPQISKVHSSVLPDAPPQGGVAAQLNNAVGPTTNMALEPPTLGGTLTANSVPEPLAAAVDPLSATNTASPVLLNRGTPGVGSPFTPSHEVTESKLNDIEAAVGSPHVEGKQADQGVLPQETVDEARDAVANAVASADSSQPLAPIAALGAQPLDLNPSSAAPAPVAPAPEPMPPMPQAAPAPAAPASPDPFTPTPAPVNDPIAPAAPTFVPPSSNGVNPNIPANLMPTSQPTDTSGTSTPPTAPPPVPPPMMPPA